MNLTKARKDLKHLKEEMEVDVEPTLITFYHWAERYYNRKVHMGELLFTTYKVDGKEVSSNPKLFLQLSDKYFRELYGVFNPVKEGKPYSWAIIMADRWRILHREDFEGVPIKEWQYNKDFQTWFEEAWQQMIVNNDTTMFNEVIVASNEVEKNELARFEEKLKGNTGANG